MSPLKKRRRSDDSESSTEQLETSMVSVDSVDFEASNTQNVRVVVRLRPLSSKELNELSTESISSDHCDVVVDKNRRFQFDAVFGPSSTQQELYDGTAGDMVKTNVFKGFNVTILAYGQTGSGKTFTMGTNGGGNGTAASSGDLSAPTQGDGVIPRAVYDLFKTRQSMEDGENRVKVEMSYLEIYNEEARDLLQDDKTGSLLNIRDGKDGVIVQNLSLVEVKSPKDVSDLMESAALRRATASTAMNSVSSRSHAICTLNVTISPSSSPKALQSCSEVIRSKLTLVDLAGSERIKRTGAEGQRMKEGININKGLFVLGQVVSALSELGQQNNEATGRTAHSHIPYRDSKLTRLLQDSLGGNSRTVVVACVSPASSNIDESINTLRYAERTRNIQNSAVRNVVATNSVSIEEANALRRENQMLKLKLLQAQANLPAPKIASHTVTSAPLSSGESESLSCLLGVSDEKLELVSRLRARIASLECKVEQMESQVQCAHEDTLEATLRADKWELKYNQLFSSVAEKNMSVTLDEPVNSDDSLVTRMRKEIADLKSQLQEAQTDAAVARATAAAVVVGGGDIANLSEMIVSTESELDLDTQGVDTDNANQEKWTAELVSMSGQIEQKEAMASQMNKERECMDMLRSHFENAVHQLQEEVNVLASERDGLLTKINDDVAEKSDSKARTRIKELEAKIAALKRKSEEHKKTLRLREQAEQKCIRLAEEIKEDKKRRAELQRKLKEESRERRSEQKAARVHASKMLRDRQKLEYELKKVKDAAARQTAVLRRKNAEALSKQKQMAEQQRKRNAAASIRQNRSGRARGSSGDRRQDELKAWMNREMESSLALKRTKSQISEHTTMLQEMMLRRREICSDDNMKKELHALDREIELRRGVVKQLEEAVKEHQKVRSESSSSLGFEDSHTWSNLTRTDAKFVFTCAFEHLLANREKSENLEASQKDVVADAVRDAVDKEKRHANETIAKLKMQHSEEVMTLLSSTKSAVENDVKQKVLECSSSDDPDFRAAVDEMIGSYLKGYDEVGEKMKNDLQSIKNEHDGMQRLVGEVAQTMIASNEVAVDSEPKKKKAKKPSRRSLVIAEEEEEWFEDEEDIPFEDSDDSDWNPETPARKKLKREKEIEKANAKSQLNFSRANRNNAVGVNEVENHENGVHSEELEKMKVAELRDLLRQRGLAVSGKKVDLLKRLRGSGFASQPGHSKDAAVDAETSNSNDSEKGSLVRSISSSFDSSDRGSFLKSSGKENQLSESPYTVEKPPIAVASKIQRKPLGQKAFMPTANQRANSRTQGKGTTLQQPLHARKQLENNSSIASPPEKDSHEKTLC